MSKKLTYEYVCEYFKKNGCNLLSESYTSNYSKLRYIAKCGHEHSIALLNFKSGQGKVCPNCACKINNDKLRLSYKDVKNYFKENECELLSLKYINSSSKLKYLAQCGHEHSIALLNFKSGQGRVCPKCAYKVGGDKKKLLYEHVKNYFKGNGCILLSESYINAHLKLKYIAKCGHDNFITVNDFKSGYGRICSKCAKLRGKDHYRWNSNLTDEDRVNRRDINENAVWRKSVYERDDYTCQITGERGGKIVAHHIKPYHKYKDLRFDVSNGITLNKEFHIFAHKIFGYKVDIGHKELIKAQYLYSKRR